MKLTRAYSLWLRQLKEKVRSTQIKAALKVNAELLNLYWHLGREMLEKEQETKWGDKLIEQLSKDLLAEFPDIKGFSRTNLFYIRKWYVFYSSAAQIVQQPVGLLSAPAKKGKPLTKKSSTKKQATFTRKQHSHAEIVQQLVGQIPWGHHLQIITKCSDINEALFYISQTTQHNWSRRVLVHQIESNLYKRKGKALTNFKHTLPQPQRDLANELLKNPYHFDFLQIKEPMTERELETALTDHLVKFLLEMGAGFAYIGRQQLIMVDGEDFFIDLLFYHTRLHSYVVVELKMDNFKPEHAGKLNFYLAAVDGQIKAKEDQPTIGLLLCKKAGRLMVEYSLKNIHTPIGVSEYKMREALPAKWKGKLPTIQQLEKEIKRVENLNGKNRKEKSKKGN